MCAASIDTEFFVDLLFTAKKIIDITTKDNILILIGDTPSYLGPILEYHRKIYHMAWSNKPLDCFKKDYQLHKIIVNKKYDRFDETWTDETYIINGKKKRKKGKLEDKLKVYFNYLNTKTFLTKKFVKENWNNIICIDTSSGTTINGFSIFFNRYVGNIPINAKCWNIKGAVPIKFINLLFTFPYIYIKQLVSYINNVIFYHIDDYTLSYYKRFVPWYTLIDWMTPPTDYNDEDEERVKVSKLYGYFKNGNKKKLLQWIKNNYRDKKLEKLTKDETDVTKIISIIYDYIVKNSKLAPRVKRLLEIANPWMSI